MSTATHTPATLDDLARVHGKAELVNGRIVHIAPHGFLPGRVAGRILLALDDYASASNVGEAFGGNLAYALHAPLPSGRQSFSPDASYHAGPFPADPMKFIDGSPTFAVEVRSENDNGAAMDREYADKRTDYFIAGTLAVWDVDPLAETITVYRHTDPLAPVVFHRGDTVDAEPALPGWRLDVDGVFA